MKTRITTFISLFLALTFFGLSATDLFAGSKDGKNGSSQQLPASFFLRKIEAGTSDAKVFSTDKGVGSLSFENPYNPGNTQSIWAGTFKGEVEGEEAFFYCIDIQNEIGFYSESNPHMYTDEGATSQEITYILNNYYPFLSYPYSGAADTEGKEAAAIQIVIWHYADGLDISTMEEGDVKTRALEIQVDTEANAALFTPLETLILVPASQTVPYGTDGSFFVSTFDVDGNNLGGIQVSLSTTSGTLSETALTTTSSGAYGPVTISQGSEDEATITAIADVVIPQGTRFLHTSGPDIFQKLVLATPAGLQRKVDALVNWFQQGNDGCNLNGYMTFTQGGWGSPSNSMPGQVRDQYFDEIFPNGLVVGTNFTLTLTSAEAVKDFLPSGSTASALTQNYTDPGNGLDNVLASQTVALTLNVMFDQAGKIGTNPVDLGDLLFADGPFADLTVYELLDIANRALGGENTGYSFSDINDAAASVNENFNDGTVDNGDLICEPEECESAVGSLIWHDENLNGLQDSGEAGIPDVDIELLYNGEVTATTTSDANGNYSFDQLLNGNYTIKIADSNFETGGPLFGWYATKLNEGNDDNIDNDGNKDTHSAEVALNCGDDLSVDFGFFLVCLEFEKTGPDTVKPGDQVWYTFTVTNCGDVTFGGGVTVYDPLINPVGSGQIWYETVLPGETYTFKKFYTATEDDCGDLMNTAIAIGHPANVAWSNAVPVAITEMWTTYVNCEEECVGEIGDRVWLDFSSEGDENNCNGLQDAGESGIANVKVYLKNSEGEIVEFTYTGLDGYYIFDELCDDTYTVEVDETTLPDGLIATAIQVGGDTSIDNNGSPYTVTLSEGNRINYTIDFGYCVEENNEEDADLRIQKEVSDTNPENGDQITYTITVTNDGPATAENVEVYDILPSGLIFSSATASQGTYDETTGLWDVGTLASGATATLGITVTVDVEEVNTTYFDLGPATGFNVFLWQDIEQPSSDTEGKMAVGRNATLGMYSVGDKLELQTPPEDVLIVGNNLIYTSGAVYNGNVVYGNSTNLPIDQVSFLDGTLRKDNVIDFDAAKSYLQSLSTQLSEYEANGTLEEPYPAGLILTGTDPFLNVFSVSGDLLSSKSEVRIEVPNGSVVLVNIDGTSVTLSGGLEVIGTDVGNVLYNFFEATNLTIQGIDVRGSILAPWAMVDFSAGVQNGQMMAKSVFGSGQFNNKLFVGNIPSTNQIVNCAEVGFGEENPGEECELDGLSSFTQGGWGQVARGENPGSIRDAYFDQVFPNGLTIGGTFTLTLSTAQDVEDFLPSGSTPSALDQSYTNPGQSYQNVLAGQIAAATLNVAFADAGITGTGPIGDLIFVGSEFAGKTMREFLVIANAHLGGDATDYTFSEINVAATMINENFIEGNINAGYFICEGGSTTNTTVSDPNEENNTDCVTITVGYEPTGGGSSGGGTSGGTWEPAAAFGITEIVYSMANDVNGDILAGTWGGNIYRSADGETWTKINEGMNVAFIWTIEVTDFGYIFVATEKGVFLSTDNGDSWNAAGLEDYDVRDLEFDGSGYLYAAAWGGGVFKSLDYGENWSEMNNGLTNLAVNSLAVTSTKEVFAATFGTGIAKYDPDTNTWTQLANAYLAVWTLAVSDDDVLYAGTYGDGLHVSSDFGATWTKLDENLPAMFIYSLVFDDENNLYVSSWTAGVYMAASSGTPSFQSVGLGGAGVSSILVDRQRSKLYAGTRNGQIFEYVDGNITDVEDNQGLPTEYDLSQNYPNPFNPTTNIKFSVVEAGMYSLKVYNILGEEVVALINDQLNAGSYTVTFEASQLSSGIYIYRLSGKDVNMVKKMMLLK